MWNSARTAAFDSRVIYYSLLRLQVTFAHLQLFKLLVIKSQMSIKDARSVSLYLYNLSNISQLIC